MKDKGSLVHTAGHKLYGPDSYDTKVGAYIAYYAYKGLRKEEEENILSITFVSLPEEERRGPYARKQVSEEARQAKYVLVNEMARDGGKVGGNATVVRVIKF